VFCGPINPPGKGGLNAVPPPEAHIFKKSFKYLLTRKCFNCNIHVMNDQLRPCRTGNGERGRPAEHIFPRPRAHRNAPNRQRRLLLHGCEPKLCAKGPEKSGKNHLNSLKLACARLNSDFQEMGGLGFPQRSGRKETRSAGVPPAVVGVPPNTFQHIYNECLTTKNAGTSVRPSSSQFDKKINPKPPRSMTFIAPPITPINPIPPIGPISLHGAGLLEASKIKVNQAGSRWIKAF
jgi:hypothetical protein